MKTSAFGFRSMSFAATIVSACFVFSSCSKENIAPSTSAQASEEVAARKAPVRIIRKKIVVTDPDIRPGVRDNSGVVLADYKIDINSKDHPGRESAEEEIRTEGLGGTGRSMRDNSTIENHRYPSGNQYHPRVVMPRTDERKMERLTKEISTDES
jgi:hypothetical protein